jgi:hypothetical protein
MVKGGMRARCFLPGSTLMHARIHGNGCPFPCPPPRPQIWDEELDAILRSGPAQDLWGGTRTRGAGEGAMDGDSSDAGSAASGDGAGWGSDHVPPPPPTPSLQEEGPRTATFPLQPDEGAAYNAFKHDPGVKVRGACARALTVVSVRERARAVTPSPYPLPPPLPPPSLLPSSSQRIVNPAFKCEPTPSGASHTMRLHARLASRQSAASAAVQAPPAPRSALGRAAEPAKAALRYAAGALGLRPGGWGRSVAGAGEATSELALLSAGAHVGHVPPLPPLTPFQQHALRAHLRVAAQRAAGHA